MVSNLAFSFEDAAIPGTIVVPPSEPSNNTRLALQSPRAVALVSPARHTQPSQSDGNPFAKYLSEADRRDWQQRRSAQTALPDSIVPDRVSPSASAPPAAQQPESMNPFLKYANPQQGTQPPPQEPMLAQPAVSNEGDSASRRQAEGWDEYFTGIARSVAQGVTFNWADEIEAFARTAFGGDQEMARARIRDEIAKFQTRHPYLSTGAEVAGAIAVPGAAGMRAGAHLAGRGAGLIRKAAAGGAVGVTEGALAGAGSAQGPVTGDDGTATARGAGTGALVGGALGAALPGAGHVVGRMFEGAGTKANRMIRDAMADDAVLAGRVQSTPTEHVRAAAARDIIQQPLRTNTSSEAVLGTLGGETVQQLARDAAGSSVGAQAMARRYADHLRSARQIDLQFQQAYAGPPIVNRTLDALIENRPALRQANAVATRNLRNMGVNVVPGEFSPQHLHQMDMALRDASERLWRAGQNAQATANDAVRDVLRGIISRRAPALAQAQERYAHLSELARRAPQATNVRNSDVNSSLARSALGAGVSLSMGHKTSAIQRMLHWAISGRDMNPRLAEAIMERMLTRATDTADFNRMMDALDRMDAPRRAAYLAAALAALIGGAQVGVLEREH